MDVKIKVAALSDAKEIAKVIRSSIKACIQDHQNDEKLLEGWLEPVHNLFNNKAMKARLVN